MLGGAWAGRAWAGRVWAWGRGATGCGGLGAGDEVRVAVLVPPQTAENDAVEITRPSSPRPGSPRPEGTMFDPEVPVFLAPDALAQLFQIDGHSRRCAIDTIERVAVDGGGTEQSSQRAPPMV